VSCLLTLSPGNKVHTILSCIIMESMKRADYWLCLGIKLMTLFKMYRSVRGLQLLTLIFPLTIFAQYQGNNWVLNDSIGIKFLPNNSLEFFTPNVSGGFRHSFATISTNKGQLLYYSGTLGLATYADGLNWNTTYFYDRTHNPIENINGALGLYNIFTIQYFLPMDTNDRYHYLVYLQPEQTVQYPRCSITWSELDITLNGGVGGFTQNKRKFVHAKSDTISQMLFPIRHANGRDWWLISHHWGNDTFFVALVSKYGENKALRQKIGTRQGLGGQLEDGGNIAHMQFDKHTNRLILNNGQQLIEMYDFDRCTGILSNPITIKSAVHPYTLGESYYVSALSPNGRFLYVLAVDFTNEFSNIQQYDLYASDINASKSILFHANFSDFGSVNHLSLAPDGKIYAICLTDTVDTTQINNANLYYLSVIENPDLAFPQCNFKPRDLWLQGRIAWSSMTGYVDYNIGPVIGSACDTLGIRVSKAQEVSEMEVSLYPNPASHTFTLRLGSVASAPNYTLRDMQGRIVQSGQATHGIPVTLLPDILSGVYMLEVRNAEKVWHHRLVVMRE
jgi:hypothetical protein